MQSVLLPFDVNRHDSVLCSLGPLSQDDTYTISCLNQTAIPYQCVI